LLSKAAMSLLLLVSLLSMALLLISLLSMALLLFSVSKHVNAVFVYL
jgi:hypothetical protein